MKWTRLAWMGMLIGLVMALPACKKMSTISSENQREREDRIISDWLAENNITNFQRTPSGLVHIPQVAGSGQPPRLNDSVAVHYTGSVLYGKVFDSSRFRGQPFGVRLGRTPVIAGWTEGLQLMRPGERALLVIPSRLAYGVNGFMDQATRQTVVPPHAILIFDIEIVAIVRQP
ncbi:MAG: FKBP-type peptidyl-prolyl cis-trans isomerase [Bernardetiaceae bacterium]|nr:FKBP-type peptidyl-prolyl cis-trans isomerase [Bernardetiaceae bacterium]